MSGKDDKSDKTVFGAALPGKSAPDAWARPAGTAAVPDARTVIQGSGGHRPDGQTWIGGPAQVPQPQGYPSSYAGPLSGQAQGYGQGGHSPFGPADAAQIGRALGDQRGFFPDIATQQSAQPRLAPRIPQAQAMQVRDLGAASSSNPIVAAAAPLLILLGRLRTGLVELQVAPLMEHVTREIDRFERSALGLGVAPHEALVAKYALSGTADDIVQNLPGSDRGSWQQYSMVARFFHKRDSGVGFFQEAEKALFAPAQNYNLLELMLVCLSLGFEGQFRTMPNGAADLARIRSAIHESLRRVHPRADEDVSVMWTPVVQGQARRFGAIPVPAIAGFATLALVALFATLLTLVNRDSALAAEDLRRVALDAPVIQIDRTPGQVYVTEIPQLQRVRDAFAAEIADGRVSVEAKGDYIAIRVGNLQLFDLGSVTVKPGFAELAGRIAEVLNGETGPVLIEGHTDNVPVSGRGRFKDNYQISAARAEGVAEVLRSRLGDASRIATEGRGEDAPIADNATPDGQAANRRVEIMLAREGTFDAPAPPPETEN